MQETIEGNRYNKTYLSCLSYSRHHFWFAHRNRIIYHVIRKYLTGSALKALEIGTGSGNVLRYISGKNISMDGADIHKESFAHITGYAKKTFLYDINDDPDRAGTADYKQSYDAVILGDVIEHVDDPVRALTNAAYFCKKGGLIIITVPALQALWSPYDVACGHRKRYDRGSLEKEMLGAGLQPIYCKYFFLSMAVILFLRRRIFPADHDAPEDCVRNEFRIGRFSNYLCSIACLVEYPVNMACQFPFGSSLIAAGRAA